MELFARTCKTNRMNVERIFARMVVLLGAVTTFWMTFGAKYSYQGSPLAFAAGFALIFTVGVLLIFVLGLFFENLAALLLVVGAIAVVVWGILAGWGAGAWGIMAFLFILPMLVSAGLYAAAARMQKICDLR